MLDELVEAGVQLPGEKDADQELWDFWVNRQGLRNKRDRCMMGRFQNCIDRCEKELCFWSMDAFEREYVALELDMLKSKRFRQKLLARGKDLDPGEGCHRQLRPSNSILRIRPCALWQTTQSAFL